MIGWLWRVLVGRFYVCRHHWETVNEGLITRNYTDGVKITNIRTATLRCTKCGELKHWEAIKR